MRIVIPYRHSFNGQELRYALRGIEKFVNNPEVLIIGDHPKWTKNVDFIPFKEHGELKWKERNIYEKLRLVKEDFIYFNDDHYLLQPFVYDYHYSGHLQDVFKELSDDKNSFSRTISNTIELFGNIKNYFRHQPMFINVDHFKKINLDWDKEWGYCIKSVYCQTVGIEGEEYPDLKVRKPFYERAIRRLIAGREYFSTGEGAMNRDMFRVLEGIFPQKSKYE